MKRGILVALIGLSTWAVYAQPSAKGETNEKIEATKIGFITERIHLSQEQAKTFWPVFEQYSTRKREYRKNVKNIRQACSEGKLTDAEILAEIRKMHQIKQNELDLDKEYLEKFVKILSPKQIAELYKAERDFTKMLLDKLGDK